jgi:predicted NUDIX family NTP pyrophosphohydrolase
MKHPTRCEVNLAPREEDCGSIVTFHACGQPAHWYVEQRGIWAHRGGYHACEQHAMEALRDSSDEVSSALTGNIAELDENGEMAVAS